MPFSAGRRVCPGMDITLTENAYVLVRLMREFERLENRDLVREYVERTRLTTESRQGVLVGLASAQN
jgi:cytochrome P450